MTTEFPTATEISKRARQLAEDAAANARGTNYNCAKTNALVSELIERITYLNSLDLDPMGDTLEELLPGFDFDNWMPMSLAIRIRASELVDDHILFPDGTCCTPDIVTETRAQAYESELIKRMSYMVTLGINPLLETWDALLPP